MGESGSLFCLTGPKKICFQTRGVRRNRLERTGDNRFACIASLERRLDHESPNLTEQESGRFTGSKRTIQQVMSLRFHSRPAEVSSDAAVETLEFSSGSIHQCTNLGASGSGKRCFVAEFETSATRGNSVQIDSKSNFWTFWGRTERHAPQTPQIDFR